MATLEAMGSGDVRILITIPYHARSAELIWKRLGGKGQATIYGHASCARRLDATLRPLAELEVDRVLVTHGRPMLQGEARALTKALDAPAWTGS